MSLDFHFAVEQRARSFLRTFFGFNGTGGVWRRAAMEGAGGWNPDSTVEDMDLSIRAYVRGWKFRHAPLSGGGGARRDAGARRTRVSACVASEDRTQQCAWDAQHLQLRLATLTAL